MSLIDHLLDALSATGHMAWQIGWSLILGFILAAAIQALVPKEKIADVLPDDSPKTLRPRPGSERHRRAVPTPPWHWPGRWSARGRTSRRR